MNTNIDIMEMDCPDCHILYWISKAHIDKLKSTKEEFFCPNGHTAYFVGKSDAEKLYEEKERRKNSEEYLNISYERENKLRKKISTYKGHITKLKKKITPIPEKKKATKKKK